jgi:hypothetical protein
MSTYNTNLASEFYVLSMLHRLGGDASLTLGNKKSVDIFIFKEDGAAITIDVKGVAKRYDWPADNIQIPGTERHFLALVCFEGDIGNPTRLPTVWIIPSFEIEQFVKKYKSRTVISRALINENGDRYKHAWDLIA